MREVVMAVAALLTADTLTSTIDSIAGSVVTLAAGEGSNWALGDIVRFDGENLYHVATITGVSGDDVTVSDAPSSAPGAGDTIGGGYQEWVRPAGGGESLIYYEPLIGDDPAKVYETLGANPPCQCRLRLALNRSTSQARERVDLELRFLGLDIQYIEGVVRRAKRLLDGQTASLSVAAHDTWQLSAARAVPVSPEVSTLGLVEYVLPLTAVVALARA